MWKSPLPIHIVKYQPLIVGWTRIIPGLNKAIEDGLLLDLSLLSNGYELRVKPELDPEILSGLRNLMNVTVTVKSDLEIKLYD